MQFVDEFLLYAQNERIITDIPNQCGYPNYPGFIENRHDQTILSLLVKKYNLEVFRRPDQSGNKDILAYPNSTYGQILFCVGSFKGEGQLLAVRERWDPSLDPGDYAVRFRRTWRRMRTREAIQHTLEEIIRRSNRADVPTIFRKVIIKIVRKLINIIAD